MLFLGASNESERMPMFQLAIVGIAGGITSFFAAFLIDVLTDMRHYLQSGNSTLAEMNSKLTGLATGQLKIEAKAEAAARVASVAEAKALAEKQAAEAMAAAKPATEKCLEWTGKAMQRAGFKEQTLKRTLTQGGTVVAWGRNGDGQTTVPAGLNVAEWWSSQSVGRTGSRVLTEPASDLALQFFKLGCALIAAADVKLSSREQLWLESHLGLGADAEILSLVTSLGPDGIQTELQSLAAQFSPQDKHWLHCRAWQLQDLAGSDGTEAEESDALACVLNACGWCELPETQRLYLLTGALRGPGRAASL